jgi:hypothetical protein
LPRITLSEDSITTSIACLRTALTATTDALTRCQERLDAARAGDDPAETLAAAKAQLEHAIATYYLASLIKSFERQLADRHEGDPD